MEVFVRSQTFVSVWAKRWKMHRWCLLYSVCELLKVAFLKISVLITYSRSWMFLPCEPRFNFRNRSFGWNTVCANESKLNDTLGWFLVYLFFCLQHNKLWMPYNCCSISVMYMMFAAHVLSIIVDHISRCSHV